MFAKRCLILHTLRIRKIRHKDPSCFRAPSVGLVMVVPHCLCPWRHQAGSPRMRNVTSIIENEHRETLRDALMRLCVWMRPLDGPPTDSAPGFASLVNDELLSRYRMSIEQGRVKNPNRNPGSVFSKKITSYVSVFVNMADSYLAAKIRKFVFSKALRIFAATIFVSYVRKWARARSLIFWMFRRFSSAHMFWQWMKKEQHG